MVGGGVYYFDGSQIQSGRQRKPYVMPSCHVMTTVHIAPAYIAYMIVYTLVSIII